MFPYGVYEDFHVSDFRVGGCFAMIACTMKPVLPVFQGFSGSKLQKFETHGYLCMISRQHVPLRCIDQISCIRISDYGLIFVYSHVRSGRFVRNSPLRSFTVTSTVTYFTPYLRLLSRYASTAVFSANILGSSRFAFPCRALHFPVALCISRAFCLNPSCVRTGGCLIHMN